MANSLTHIGPYPIKNCLFTLEVAFRVAAGTPTDPTTPDTEISSDGGATSADCTNEITTGSGNGAGYITLTSTETNANVLWVVAKSANCLTTLIPLYPRVLASVGTGTLSAGSAGGGTLGTLLAYDVTGCFIQTTGGTGGAAGALQVRKIVTYNTGTGALTVTPNWETTPDATTTYSVLLPEGVTLGMLRALNPTTAGSTLTVTSNRALSDLDTIKAQAVTNAAGVTFGAFVGQGTAAIVVDATGRVNAFLIGILTTVFTEGAAGRIAAAFKQFFNVASSTGTVDLIPRVTLTDTASTVTGGATAAQINSLAVNTRANLNIPVEIETPDSSTLVYKIRLHLFDVEGNMEAPDSSPTVALTNAAGTDRSGRLSVASNPSTGVYTWDYTATAGDAEEQLVWVITVVEGGLTRTYAATSYVVEESAYRFSSTDRATLNAAATATALATLSTKVGTPAGASVSVDIAAVKTDTGGLVTTVGVAGAGLSAIPKTGYILAATGLDSIPTTAPTGVASTFREMLVQTWRRFFKKSTLTATQLKTYADDGSTLVTTQVVSDDLTTQTQGPAS